MDIQILASGSTGNCYKISNQDTTLLIECGIPYRELQKKLHFKTHDIDACLITHEHMDHAKSAKDLVKAGIDCYMTKGTAESLNLTGHRVKTFKPWGDSYILQKINSFLVQVFRTVHDAAEPVGFFITDLIAGEKLLFITDTGYITYTFPAVDYMMIECNYIQSIIDAHVLQGKLNINLRHRIVKNHMSLERVIEILKASDLSRIKEVYITHLSQFNSDGGEILQAVQRATGVPVYVC